MAAPLHAQPGGLDAQVLDRLSRRLAGLGAEGAAELARTEMRRGGERANRERLVEVAPGIGQRALDPVGFGLQLEQRRKLRLAAGPSVIDLSLLKTLSALA
jgi:hypothetical protein